ncbi:MAG: hypothetical protein E6123_15085, partial [Clostridiales bacterium]|nr:hypothetical protein [Clostridiales bacterium]
ITAASPPLFKLNIKQFIYNIETIQHLILASPLPIMNNFTIDLVMLIILTVLRPFRDKMTPL